MAGGLRNNGSRRGLRPGRAKGGRTAQPGRATLRQWRSVGSRRPESARPACGSVPGALASLEAAAGANPGRAARAQGARVAQPPKGGQRRGPASSRPSALPAAGGPRTLRGNCFGHFTGQRRPAPRIRGHGVPVAAPGRRIQGAEAAGPARQARKAPPDNGAPRRAALRRGQAPSACPSRTIAIPQDAVPPRPQSLAPMRPPSPPASASCTLPPWPARNGRRLGFVPRIPTCRSRPLWCESAAGPPRPNR